MSLSQFIKKSLIGFFVVLALYFYKFLATQFNLPIVLSSQWYTLTGVIVFLVSLASWSCVLFNLCLLFKVDKTCNGVRVSLYNQLGDNKLSSMWQVVIFIITGIIFQYGYYPASIALFGIGLNIATFRMLHSDIIKEASVQVLNSKPKR
jgi:hypothetical protein